MRLITAWVQFSSTKFGRLPPPQPISCRSSGISAFVPSAQIRQEWKHTRRPTFCLLLKKYSSLKLGCVNMHINLTKLHLKLVLPSPCRRRKLFRELVRQNCTLERGGRKETKKLLIAVQPTSSPEVTKSNVTTSFSSLLAKRLSLKRTSRVCMVSLTSQISGTGHFGLWPVKWPVITG